METRLGIQRLVVLRRLYLYLVAFVCLTTLQVNVRTLSRAAADYWSGLTLNGLQPTWQVQTTLDDILRAGSFILVAAVFHLVHWGVIQGYAQRDEAERSSRWRKLYLYLTALVALYGVASALAEFMTSVIQTAMGMPVMHSFLAWEHLLTWLMRGGISGLILGHSLRMMFRERGQGMDAALVRMLEGGALVLPSLVALLLLLPALNSALSELLLPLLAGRDPNLNPDPALTVPQAVAVAWVSLLVLMQVGQVRRWMIQGEAHFPTHILHLAFLHVGSLLGLGVLLEGSHELLKTLLRGLPLAGFESPFFSAWQAVPLLGVTCALGFAAWWTYRRLWWQASAPARIGLWAEVLQRGYHYAVATIGLGIAAFGLGEVIRNLQGYIWPSQDFQEAEVSLKATETEAQYALVVPELTDFLPGISALLVSLPVLILAWRAIQRHGAATGEPRHQPWVPVPRRLYLYGVTIATTLILIGIGGQTLFALMRLWIAEADSLTADRIPLDGLVTAALILLLHLRLLRRELRARDAQTDEARAAALRRELESLHRTQDQTRHRIQEVERALAEFDSPSREAPLTHE